MSINKSLKECRILPHTQRGERKWQIQGIGARVFEEDTKSDRVWGGQCKRDWNSKTRESDDSWYSDCCVKPEV